MKIAGVVVLYNYNEEIINNIKTYSKYCTKIYGIDNSDKLNNNIKNEIVKIQNFEYINLKRNRGIAKALNVGLQKAKEDNFEWVLTMDQDSFFSDNLISYYKKLIEKQESNKIAIISPVYKIDRKKTKQYLGYKKIKYTMQSANLMNVRIWNEIGKFKEDFFIDVVDYEYCYRCIKNNYEIYQCGKALLNHKPGETKEKKILWLNYKYGYCSPERIYYQSRNLLWTAKKYHSINMYLILIMKLGKIILLFNNKKEFLKMYRRGVRDCLDEKFGKLQN